MPISSALSNTLQQPGLLYYYSQKAIRSPRLRERFGSMVAKLVGQPVPVCPSGEVRGIAEALRTDGICFLPQLKLSPADLAEISAHLADKYLYDWYDSNRLVKIDSGIPKDMVKLSYRAADLVGCKPLVRLANSPVVLDAVTQVLGARPTIGWFESWWTVGDHQTPESLHYDDAYHRDVDDFKFVKLFAYLTDTDAENGAHSFVRGSHRSDYLTRRGTITDKEVEQHYAPDDIMTVVGQAGSVFLEDTWGIHRPLLARKGRRQIFSALYALTPWVPRNARHMPDLALPEGLDPYVNRVLFRRSR